MPSIFIRIIEGEIPGTFVWRDELAEEAASIRSALTQIGAAGVAE